MTFLSYAQNFEDVMLWRALRDATHGFWIDVGAADPDEYSVTRAFSERGWRGINVEPAERPFRLLQQARPNDINLRLALGEASGAATLFVVDDASGLTTTDAAIAAGHAAAGRNVARVTVPCATLAEICAAHMTGPVHFLKIDVEGAERAVLAGADFQRFRPWIVLVEATLPGSQAVAHTEWEHILLAAGYRFVYFDGLNRFYVADERAAELAPHFQAPPNVFDGFTRISDIDHARIARLAAAETALAAAHAGIDRLVARAEAAETQVAVMLASTSWRITRPLRDIVTRVRKTLRHPRLAPVRAVVRAIRPRPAAIPAAMGAATPHDSLRTLPDAELMALRARTMLGRTRP